MSFGGPGFVIAIVAMSMIAWVIITAIRARHGYPLTDDWGNAVHPRRPQADETTRALTAENEQLKWEAEYVFETDCRGTIVRQASSKTRSRT